MVVFDTTVLLLFLDPDAMDPATDAPVDRCKDRIGHLISVLEKRKDKILIPTPVLSEILVRAGDAGPEYLDILNMAACFRIAPFDQRAAVEVAAMTREAIDEGDKKGGSESTWAKVKFDCQIAAIAKVESAATIYSDDGNLARFARKAGLTVIPIHELPLPPESTQQSLDFEEKDNSSEK